MKKLFIRMGYTIFTLGLLFSFLAVSASAQNSISGIVFDNNRQPVSDIYVELLDEVERLIASRKTKGGFYTFQRLNRGIYYLKVRNAGTNFKEKKIRIDLGDLNAIGGVDVKQQDIFLEVDKRGNENRKTVTGVVFVQEVPENAQNYYEQGLKDFKKNKDSEGIKNLKMAIQIFPEYFNALEKLGEVYLNQKKFTEAENVFKKSTEVNKKSFTSYFNLAIAQNNLNKKVNAAETLKKANEIDGNSINSHLLLGIIQRKLKQFNYAEKNLLKAKQLSKNKEADVNWQLAELFYFELKKPDKAVEELKSFLKNLSEAEKKNNPKKIANIKKLIKNIRSEVKKAS